MKAERYNKIVREDKWGLSYDELLMALHQFDEHLRVSRYDRANQQNGSWHLTFNQWIRLWVRSGHYHERGAHAGGYVMARLNGTGPWCKDNVHIIRHNSNVSLSNHRNLSYPETKYHNGAKRAPCPVCQKELAAGCVRRHLLGLHGFTNERVDDLYLRLISEKQPCPSSF